MRLHACSTIALLASFLAPGCGGSSNLNGASRTGAPVNVENPTGDCTPPDSGARAGYHDPGDTVWLPDCKNPLKREYWRVFATTAETAYIMPRPDGDPGLEAPCTNKEHPLYAIVQYYALCQPASSPEAVARINSIHPADALAVTHALHETLRFEVKDEGVGIAPSPIPTDVIDACKLHPNDDHAELAAICQREKERLETGQDIGFRYEGAGAEELVRRLNELYGIAVD